MSFVILYAGAALIGVHPFSRIYLLIHFLSFLILVAINRIGFYYYLDNRAKTTFNSRQVLMVGTDDRVRALSDALDQQRSWGHQVIGYLNLDGKEFPGDMKIPSIGHIREFDRILKGYQVDEVIFALPKDYPIELSPYLMKCEKIGVSVRILPAMFDLENPSLRVEAIQGIPTLTNYFGIASASALLYKRLLDLAVGSVGFILFLLI
jgi:FlaA1/EpsC-like NDP-sugar epimerase